MTLFRDVAAGLFGAAIGSFLNVVIYRVPRGQSIVAPGSRCPSCGEPISPRDNIPILSWFVLRGRCRHCRAEISPRYPAIEAATAALWVAAFVRFRIVEQAALVAIFASIFLALAAIDLEHRRLPDAIVAPSAVLAVAWLVGVSIAEHSWRILTTGLVCGVVCFVVLFVIALFGMGFGDVKLAGVIGLVAGRFGWPVAFSAIFASFISGGLVGIVLLASGRKGRKATIPFGPALALGAVIALFVGPGPVRQWLGL